MSLKMIHRAGAAAAATAIALTGLVACSEAADTADTADTAESTAGSAASEESSFPRTVSTVDGAGAETEVTIDEQPQRIVSASVSLTGALLALDAPVVATGGGQGASPVFSDEEGFAVQWEDVARERGVESMYQNAPSAEAILAQNPDLVVMSNVGGDKATDVYAQIAEVVPVIVIDYSKQSWEDVTTQLGEVTGREERAEEVITEFNDKVDAAAEKITLPPQPVNVVSLPGDGGMNFFTRESAQGELFTELGFELAVPPEELIGTTAQGRARSDIKGVTAENIAPALTGETVFVLNLDPGTPADEQIRAMPDLQNNPAIAGDRVVALGPEAFRLDFYSATDLVEYLEGLYAKN